MKAPIKLILYPVRRYWIFKQMPKRILSMIQHWTAIELNPDGPNLQDKLTRMAEGGSIPYHRDISTGEIYFLESELSGLDTLVDPKEPSDLLHTINKVLKWKYSGDYHKRIIKQNKNKL